MGGTTVPVFEPEAFAGREKRREGKVVGVVLAAGGSKRFGDANKLLTDIDGTPMVRRAVETFEASELESILAVLGDDAAAVSEAIGSGAVQCIHNSEWESGQSTSVLAGLHGAAERGANAIVFGLGDMPWVKPATVDLLVEAFYRTDASVIAAAYRGKRGNPVLFAESTFDALEEIQGDTGGRDVLLDAEGAVAIETGDPGVRRDVDRPVDLETPSNG